MKQQVCDTASLPARVLAGSGRLEQITALLQSAIETPATFVVRDEARRWLAEIKARESAREAP